MTTTGTAACKAPSDALNVQAAHFRHVQIKHHAGGFVVLDRAQESPTGCKGLDGETGRADQPRQGRPNVLVIVHHGQQCFALHRVPA
jgi:hypothetical protein